MKIIPLTQNKDTVVSNQDYLFLMKWKWHYCKHSNGISGYAQRKHGNGHVRMHKIIAERMGLIGPIDHGNRNKLDNRRSNLRRATQSQNGANSFLRSNNKSGFRGVSWYEQTKQWHAQITVEGRVKHLIYSPDKFEAARAYNQAALHHFGKFARLNKGV